MSTIENPLHIGVIGYGYWGPNLVRNFLVQAGSTVTMVADLSEQNRGKVQSIHPGLAVTQSADELIHSDQVDAVAIATPVSTHFALGMAAIEAGKHVLIEKPLTTSSQTARQLVHRAALRKVVLMVDHTFVYTGAVREIRQLIDSGELGELYYFDSARVNLGLLQEDVSVLWDLAPHDLSILLYCVQERPTEIQAAGYQHVSNVHEMASINLHYPSGFHAHIRVSWLSPVKMRMTVFGGQRKKVVFDDVEPSDKVRVYDKGITMSLDEDVTPQKPIYRAGDVFIPKLDRTEALQVETGHFVECIRTGGSPLTGGPGAIEVIEILEAAERSIAQGGAAVALSPHIPVEEA